VGKTDEHGGGEGDEELIRRAIASRREQKKLVERLDPLVRAPVRITIRRWPGQRIGTQDEDDLVSEIFAALFADGARDLQRYRESRGTLRNYVSKFAHSRLFEIERKELRRSELVPRPQALEAVAEPRQNDPGPDELVIAAQRARRIRDCVDKHLSARGREMLRLMFDLELSTDEMEEMGFDRPSIFRWRSIILAAARDCLSDFERN
jgi:hypothetical protein